MKPEIKRQWIAALRSGKYKQGRNHMRNGNRWCCLGVLCNLVAPGDWDEKPVIYDIRTIKGMKSYPPHYILTQASLSWTSCKELSDQNDSGISFTKIANWIEENL